MIKSIMQKKFMRVRKAVSTLVIVAMIGSVFALPALNDEFSVQAAQKTKKVKITYNVNGGKFTTKKYQKKKSYVKKIKKKKKIGTLPKATKEGYKLVGWYTNKSKGKKVSKKTKIKKNTKLYARWVPNTYSITFKGRNGAADTVKSIKYDAKYSTVMPTPTFPGNKFNGWYTEPTGGVRVELGEIYKHKGNTTLYAQWLIGTYGIGSKRLNYLGNSYESLKLEVPMTKDEDKTTIIGNDRYEYYYAKLKNGGYVDFVFKNNICIIVSSNLEDMMERLKNTTPNYSKLKAEYGTSIDRSIYDTVYESIFKIGNINLLITYEIDNGRYLLDKGGDCAIYSVPQAEYDRLF